MMSICYNTSSWQSIFKWVLHPQNESRQLTLPRLAWPMVILPELCSLERRQPRSHMAWMLPSILTSFSWFSWNAASGTPNCFLSPRYLIKYSTVRAAQQEWVHENIVNRSLIISCNDEPLACVVHPYCDADADPGSHDTTESKRLHSRTTTLFSLYLLWTTKLFLTYVWKTCLLH